MRSDVTDRGAGMGTGDRHVPSEITTLKFFCLNSKSYGMSDIQSNFQHIFRVLGSVAAQTHRGLCACMDPAGDATHSFVPLRNKFLATPLVTDPR